MDLNLAFWGKSASHSHTPAPNERDGPPYKPVLHHLLDVAAVAQTFLFSDLARLRRETALVGMAPEDYSRLERFPSEINRRGFPNQAWL